MSYIQPSNREEYNQAMTANTKISGFFDQVTTHSACFFCGAPDFAAWRIVTTHEDMAKPHTCKECERTAAMLTHYRADGYSITTWPVQLAGNPAPEWAQIIPWNGCPAASLRNGAGIETLYINIPHNQLNQFVCTLMYAHTSDHEFHHQDSAEGRQSRQKFLDIIDG